MKRLYKFGVKPGSYSNYFSFASYLQHNIPFYVFSNIMIIIANFTPL